ncbi:hypothetical protein [Rhizobium leguminosarum]|uniref:hypothetical protein n=1 Tax=Rhizobium leguminosarum TaxID=384 RepID=UPI001181D96F|nr:hypothetical protein [Rhizobium leguminosarum]
MATVTGILCQMITGNVDGAGTDGRVYLGLGGREFRLDSGADDYERGSWREYILGRGPVEPNLPPPQVRVNNPNRNDPRTGLRVDTSKLGHSPVYIRFENEGGSPDWNLKSAIVLVYTADGFAVAYLPPAGFDNLWMGHGYGKILYLTDDWWRDEKSILDAGREIAKRNAEAKIGA